MTAAEGARRDLRDWTRMLQLAEVTCPDAREVDVTGYDPSGDLDRRGRWWSHRFPSARLPDVLAFGVALADAEATAWEAGDGVTAARAFEDRRFLLGDRLVHWLVPYTFGIDGGDEIRTVALAVGDRTRPAPALTPGEGLTPPGEDSFGPVDRPLRVALGPSDRWRQMAADHPGTARLWTDLARRAD